MLAEQGELHSLRTAAYRWVADSYPAEGVSLRASGDDTVVIQDVSQGRPVVIGEVDRCHRAGAASTRARSTSTKAGRISSSPPGLGEAAGRGASRPKWITTPSASESVDLEVSEIYDADGGPRRAGGPTAGSRSLPRRPPSARSSATPTRRSATGRSTCRRGSSRPPPTGCGLPPRLSRRLEAEGILLAPNDYGPDWPRAQAGGRWRATAVAAASAARPSGEGRLPTTSTTSGPSASSATCRARTTTTDWPTQLDNLITLCPACHHRAEAARGTRSALGGLAYALGNIAPLFLMCDPRDLGSMVGAALHGNRRPDHHPLRPGAGGAGPRRTAVRAAPELLEGALEPGRSAAPARTVPGLRGAGGSRRPGGQGAHRAAAAGAAREIAQHPGRRPKSL